MRKTSVSFASFALILAAVGCHGGGGGSSTGTTTGTGTNNTGGGGSTAAGSISVTDAASDDIESFDVNVTAIDLTRQDGTIVHALPQTQRVDFAELVNESQLLSAFSLYAGTYKDVQITFDLSAAASPQVMISGNSTVATLLDTNGNTINGSITETIRFPNNNPLVVTPGLHADIALDFDLDASCTIDATANTVQLGTVIQATQNPVVRKASNVFGTLASVDSSSLAYTITLNAPLQLKTGPSLTVQTSASTVFHVDGVVADFSTFAAKPAGSAVLAQGGFQSGTFQATAVEAWTPLDAVEGHVLSRDAAGNLTIVGRGEVVGSGSATFNAQFTVNATTASVFQRAIPAATAPAGTTLTQDAINVGQRIVARGKLSGSALDATVSHGHVVLEETGIFGYANGAVSGSTLALNVVRFGRRPVGKFDFTVGTASVADPTNYLINVSTLAGSLSTVGAGTPIAVRGIMTPVSTPAGSANANALSVADRSATGSFLSVGWPLLTASPFSAASSSSLTLDLTGSGKASVDQGGISPIAFAKTDVPTIVPLASAANPLYGISQDGVLTFYTDFASWQADVASRLQGGAKARFFAALGKYDATTKTLSAARAGIFLH